MNKTIAEIVYQASLDRIQKGDVPRIFGLAGILALMHDKIRRYGITMDKDEVLDIASDGLFAVELILGNTLTLEEEGGRGIEVSESEDPILGPSKELYKEPVEYNDSISVDIIHNTKDIDPEC